MLSASDALKLGENQRKKKLEEERAVAEKIEKEFFAYLDGLVREATLKGNTTTVFNWPFGIPDKLISSRLKSLGYRVSGPHTSFGGKFTGFIHWQFWRDYGRKLSVKK